MEGIKATFARCKAENRTALVGYFTAGYPTPEETPDIMLGLQAGGVGEIEPSFDTLEDANNIL
jgi:tryptophan synthase